MTSDDDTPRPPSRELGDAPEERPSGEDHRDGPPGYDLDEQAVYADEQRRREAAGDGEADTPAGG